MLRVESSGQFDAVPFCGIAQQGHRLAVIPDHVPGELFGVIADTQGE